MNFNFLLNQTIKIKILLISISAILYFIVLVGLNQFLSYNVKNTLNNLTQNELIIARTTKMAIIDIERLNKLAIYNAITGEFSKNNENNIYNLNTQVLKQLDRLKDIIYKQDNEQLTKLIDNINLRYKIYSKMALSLDKSFKKDFEDGIDDIYGLHAISTKMGNELSTLANITNKHFNKRIDELYNMLESNFTTSLVTVIMSILLFSFFTRLIGTNIINSINMFQKGLTLFFDYLSNPKKKVTPIDIISNDEIGQMAKNVNNNIKVSMSIHDQMAQLIDVMDKNVISSETDENGIITHVSQAFCNISGYTKDELINKPHNIVRDKDMPKEIFKELWETIKSGKIWEGEVKNTKKDGGFYWAHTIISPMCTSTGEHFGYTAIRYDITDKKEVEELSSNLELKILSRTSELIKQKEEFEKIYNGTKDPLAILDMKSKFLQVNPAYCEMTGYTEKELLNDTCFNLTVDEDKEPSIKAVQEILKVGYIKNFEKSCIIKDNKIINTNMSMSLLENPQRILISVRDITKQKEMEKEIQERTKELNSEKKLISSIINSQDSIVVTSDGKRLKTINQAFKDFYQLDTIEDFENKYGMCICNSFENDVNDEYIKEYMNGTLWMNYILSNKDDTYKVVIKRDNENHIFSLSLDSFIFEDQNFITVVLNDITELEKTKKEIESIHKHTRDSIEYAALIQSAILPDNKELNSYFKDHFITWTPKDTVGGDIWLFNELRHEDECLLFFIDCTGHGVPGAFVTMIVKAIEREIISKLKKHHEFDISPAIIMGYFNKTMKKLLRQESKDSLSNAGWDGGIIYYNRRTQILKFAGAETPLFYMTVDGEFKTIKGNRYSVGYKKCDSNYEYKETIIEVEEGMKFYCTTDGYLDQNGGPKDFPFGKKRFGNIIKEYYKEPMKEIQSQFHIEMAKYESIIIDNDRNDDMTIIGFEIGVKSDYIEDIIEEIVKYEGVMTQNVIASCMDNIEAKISNMGLLGTISTITIEYCQNMMNYSKNDQLGSREIIPAGIIEVKYINNSYYEIIASNIVAVEDKEKIEPKLIEIQSLDKSAIKKRYRELRKSGQNTHEKGGGIGMYEIAKVSENIEYNFTKINDDKYNFTMKSIVKSKSKVNKCQKIKN